MADVAKGAACEETGARPTGAGTEDAASAFVRSEATRIRRGRLKKKCGCGRCGVSFPKYPRRRYAITCPHRADILRRQRIAAGSLSRTPKAARVVVAKKDPGDISAAQIEARFKAALRQMAWKRKTEAV